MNPAFYATTCRSHNKVKHLICGCPLFVIHRKIRLYTNKQVREAYLSGFANGIIEEKLAKKERINDGAK